MSSVCIKSPLLYFFKGSNLEKKLKATGSSNSESAYKENEYELNNEQKSKIKQIFQLLRNSSEKSNFGKKENPIWKKARFKNKSSQLDPKTHAHRYNQNLEWEC